MAIRHSTQRVIGLLFLLSARLLAADVSYLPENTEVLDTGRIVNGLCFAFTNPTASTATITVDTIQDGKPVRVTQEVDTDPIHGDPDRLVFWVMIDSEHRYDLARVQITMGNASWTIEHMKSAEHYELPQPRRRSQ